MKNNSDAEAVHMMHTCRMIRNEIFSRSFEFEGSFDVSNQTDSVPETMLSFVSMLLNRPGNFQSRDNQAALSISQLIIFNAVKRPRK